MTPAIILEVHFRPRVLLKASCDISKHRMMFITGCSNWISGRKCSFEIQSFSEHPVVFPST